MMANQELLGGIEIFSPDKALGTATVYQTATNSINMKNYRGVLAVLVLNSAGTAHAVTMKEGTTSTASTALAFTKYWYKTTAGWTEGTAGSNTFNADGATASVFAVPVTGDMLTKTAEAEASYVRMDVAAQTATASSLFYICYGPRYGGNPAAMPSIT